ncbi:LysR family transcriptional regulator [Enterovibrio norvegicus FF-33]|uniref:LysR family transcriptional regulator n=1 Tax=Enterovibrio norvegicus FF-454 TaxID=1185651 RepID=A0A1E5C955_9GAMM|nr:LysR family transcriptional regulator [Enterovibrio norvegicus]OEE61722.1 LysR family transcriptional regulator [Enterovibrio norvegicus FF-454]OEE66519.1 LysR family transcriptional regulator [Enterovibrio norvegicus FF-33]
MSRVNWRGVDLNLLVAFSALMDTRSVTRAAEKLSIGQSAMSHNLSRLRSLLDDPLFHRQGNEMLPTARAIELEPVITQLLETIASDVLTPMAFEPSQYQGVVRIGLTDYAELVFAPALFDVFRQQAPHCQLSCRPVDRVNYREALKADQVDVVLGAVETHDPTLRMEDLYTERHVCLFDPVATALKSPLTLDDYITTPHALVTVDGQLSSPVDDTLKAFGCDRQVVMGSQRFLTVRHLLSGRNLICTVAELMAKLDMFNTMLAISPAPVDVSNFVIRQIWHKKHANSAKNLWIRQTIHQTVRQQVQDLRAR